MGFKMFNLSAIQDQLFFVMPFAVQKLYVFLFFLDSRPGILFYGLFSFQGAVVFSLTFSNSVIYILLRAVTLEVDRPELLFRHSVLMQFVSALLLSNGGGWMICHFSII